MPRRYAPDPVVDRSLRYAVRDGVAYSVMHGAGELYFAAYAVFLKASTAQLAFLSAIPPLAGSLAQLLAAWLARRGLRRRPVMLAGVATQVLAWPPMLLLPFVFPQHAVPLFIACVVGYLAAGQLASPAWASLMGDLVPPKRRGRFFAHRTRLMSLTGLAALAAAGLTLHLADGMHAELAGFALVFLAAAAARTYSAYTLARMHEPPPQAEAVVLPFRRETLVRLGRSRFARFSLFNALMSFAVAMAGPFYALYMLRDLGFTYLQLMAATATAVATQFLSLPLWGRAADRFGSRAVILASGMVIPVATSLWAFAGQFWHVIGLQIIGGLGWAGYTLAVTNYLYESVEAPKRTTYFALNAVLAALGVFVGAMAGGALTQVVSAELALGPLAVTLPSALGAVFLISAALRVTLLLLLFRRLPEVRSTPLAGPDARGWSAWAALVFGGNATLRRRPRG